MVKRLTGITGVVVLVLGMVGAVWGSEVAPLPKRERLRVATTTSLYDTGLWSYLEPMFEEKHGVELDIIYAGTGIALQYGRRGDVDVLTIHDPSREKDFVSEGYGVSRNPFAYNYFVIVGPPDDPAGIEDLEPEEALMKLVQIGKNEPKRVKFVSRGDNSGTHGKEKAIWRSAGMDYASVQESGSWYVEAGRGMGPTLLMAAELGAYTLSDMGTFLAYRGELNLTPLVKKGDILLNIYSAIAINPDKFPKTNIIMANELIDFLLSEETQELIGDYGVAKYGMQLFTPCTSSPDLCQGVNIAQ